MGKGNNRPVHYEDRERGRIVEGIYNFNNSSARFYETEYTAVREALAETRFESPTLFRKAIGHVINKYKINDEDLNAINKKLSSTIGGIDSELVQWVISDWHKDSPSFRKEYEPSYLLRVSGQPVQHSVYNAIEGDVKALQAGDIATAKTLGKMIKQGDHINLVYPDEWFKKNAPDEDGMARRAFLDAAKNFRPIDIKIAQKAINNNPLWEQEPETEQKEALEIM